MSTTAELIAHRTTSGARYAAAVAELKAATIELAALDETLRNSRVDVHPPIPGFGPLVDPISLRHAEFALDVPGGWADEIVAALEARLAAHPTPDPE